MNEEQFFSESFETILTFALAFTRNSQMIVRDDFRLLKYTRKFIGSPFTTFPMLIYGSFLREEHKNALRLGLAHENPLMWIFRAFITSVSVKSSCWAANCDFLKARPWISIWVNCTTLHMISLICRCLFVYKLQFCWPHLRLIWFVEWLTSNL